MARHDKKGRRKGGPPFVQIFNYVVDSPAYLGLSPLARAALIEICRLYRGDNNGRLVVPVRWLAERLGVGRTTVSRALTDIDDAGFIRCMKFGSFRIKDRTASEYRITFHRDHVTMTPPTRDFLRTHSPKDEIHSPAGGTVAA